MVQGLGSLESRACGKRGTGLYRFLSRGDGRLFEIVLKFYDDGHVYELDGKIIPSVSELLRFMSREVYGDIDKYILDHGQSVETLFILPPKKSTPPDRAK